MASSPSVATAAVGPELTAWAEPVVPVADTILSPEDTPAAWDRPEYSPAATPTSAAALTVAVITGLVPPVATTAVHTLSWVWSEAGNEAPLLRGPPALSVTVSTTGAEPLHTPTWTINRLFFVVFNGVVTARLV